MKNMLEANEKKKSFNKERVSAKKQKTQRGTKMEF